MRCWNRIALALLCCAVFAACKTQETSGASSVDPATCESSCDAAYDRCANHCEQTDNNMCSEECVDAIESCKRRCG